MTSRFVCGLCYERTCDFGGHRDVLLENGPQKPNKGLIEKCTNPHSKSYNGALKRNLSDTLPLKLSLPVPSYHVAKGPGPLGRAHLPAGPAPSLSGASAPKGLQEFGLRHFQVRCSFKNSTLCSSWFTLRVLGCLIGDCLGHWFRCCTG